MGGALYPAELPRYFVAKASRDILSGLDLNQRPPLEWSYNRSAAALQIRTRVGGQCFAGTCSITNGLDQCALAYAPRRSGRNLPPRTPGGN